MFKRFLITFGLAATLASAQTFDAASIRPSAFQSADGEGSRRESIETSPGTLTMRNVTLRSCLSWAYNILDFQIEGSASGVDRYDITAKASGPATVDELRVMLRSLLTDRFKLTSHRDNKVLPAFALVVAKGGPKLSKSKEDGPGLLRPSKASLRAEHASIQEFADSLPPLLRTPVINKTDLAGRYDFTLDLMPYLPEAKNGDLDIISLLISALKEQLGLTLESRKESVEILVVDHAEKTPGAN